MSDFKYIASAPTDGFTVISEGTYNIKVENAETGFTVEKKTPMITLTCGVIGNDAVSGKLFERLLFQPNCAWKIDQIRAGLGFVDDAGAEILIDPDDFIGRTGWVTVGHREYKGKTQPEITRWIFDEFEIEELALLELQAPANALPAPADNEAPF